jgi:hypothetical protein
MTSLIRWSARTGKVASLCLALLLAAGSVTGGAAAASDPQSTVRSFYGTLLGTQQQLIEAFGQRPVRKAGPRRRQNI